MNDLAGQVLRLAFLAAALAAAAPAMAIAQADFPRRAVKFVVPVPPGNMLDSMPRIIGEKLSARWGQPVIVEMAWRGVEPRKRGGREIGP